MILKKFFRIMTLATNFGFVMTERSTSEQSGYQPQEIQMKLMMTITRNEERQFKVVSGPNTYTVAAQPKVQGIRSLWSCSCPARGMCKHLRTVLGAAGMGIGQTITIEPRTDSTIDADLAHSNRCDTREDCIDLGRHPQEIRDEIHAASRGRAAYRRFLGY
jgi:hypothetical protein